MSRHRSSVQPRGAAGSGGLGEQADGQNPDGRPTLMAAWSKALAEISGLLTIATPLLRPKKNSLRKPLSQETTPQASVGKPQAPKASWERPRPSWERQQPEVTRKPPLNLQRQGKCQDRAGSGSGRAGSSSGGGSSPSSTQLQRHWRGNGRQRLEFHPSEHRIRHV